MVHLSVEDALKLLQVKTIPGKPWQVARFHKWIERVVECRGESFVMTNRLDLLNQWEKFTKGTFKNCV